MADRLGDVNQLGTGNQMDDDLMIPGIGKIDEKLASLQRLESLVESIGNPLVHVNSELG